MLNFVSGSAGIALRGFSDNNPHLYSGLNCMLLQALRRNTVGCEIRIIFIGFKILSFSFEEFTPTELMSANDELGINDSILNC